MSAMIRAAAALTILAVLAGCENTEPAGGRGPFDPPSPPKVNAPIFASPGATEFRPFPPTGPVNSPADPADELAADVTEALRTTQPQSPGSVVPVTGTPVQTAGVTPGATTTAAAQPDPFQQDIGIDPNDTSIDLNQSSQEEQKRQREIAERRRQAARDQLVIVQPEAVQQVDPNANVVQFARSTQHPVGTKVYNRPAFRDRVQSASVCRRFSSNDEAQRQFLANGGPSTDRYNLDPDGDGFACDFDPTTYRSLDF